uniref:Uncharacterized protein n=1 Tax=viral metagenome TaxID=1070528 RepID=A0A6C0ESB8_9ZZZZ
MDYEKLINVIIKKNSCNLDRVYHKLCELEDLDEKSYDEISQYFFSQTCYYYNSTTNLYIEYNENYKIINENNMLHAILKFISKYQDIYLLNSNQKQNIKTQIQKKIKERSIYNNIPESITLQNILSFLHPNIFIERNIAKYFMITLGDIILKKTDLFYFIPNYMKPLITVINKYVSMYFYNMNLGNHYKYKYAEHDSTKSRVIPFNIIDMTHYTLDNSFIVNLICVSIHYSNRYENGDKFIETTNEKVKTLVNWIKDTPKESLINSFIKEYICVKEGHKINEKDMLFLWKSYIKKNNIINIFSRNNDIYQFITNKLKFNEGYINVTSMYLPYVLNFKEFWNKYIFTDENNYEINELFILFTDTYNIKNIDENIMYDLIKYYFPDIQIEGKFILNVGCTLWNKKKDVNTFLLNHKDSDKNELYSIYCSESKEKKVNKQYFMSFIK